MKDGQPVMAFGLMGGSMQAQGHAQVLIDMIDLGANPRRRVMPRGSAMGGVQHAESRIHLYDLVGTRLKALGHHVESANGEDMGGYQAIWFLPGLVQQVAHPRPNNRSQGSIGRRPIIARTAKPSAGDARVARQR